MRNIVNPGSPGTLKTRPHQCLVIPMIRLKLSLTPGMMMKNTGSPGDLMIREIPLIAIPVALVNPGLQVIPDVQVNHLIVIPDVQVTPGLQVIPVVQVNQVLQVIPVLRVNNVCIEPDNFIRMA